ncbi:MAG: 2OG-Fe(II) oxygenase [Caulobacterales bacterium]|nr:2OG-Fe(II) oxygenase [Caulobacterales bacterium]
MSTIRFRRVASEARIFVADGFLDEDEIAAILAAAGEGTAYGAQHDGTGLHFELPLAAAPELTALQARLEAVLGFANLLGDTFRFRRYHAGEGHPPHVDCYAWSGAHLVVTAMLWLTCPAQGGETRFGRARPAALRLEPRRGRLAMWMNYGADGRPDPLAWHEGLAVAAGEKTTLTSFIYADRAVAPAFAPGLEADPAIPGVVLEA